MEGNETNLRLVIIYLLFFIVCITMIFTLSACTEVIDNPSITHTPTQANTNDPTQATGTPTVTVTPTETVTQTPSPTPTPTLTPNTSPGTEVSTHAEFYGKKIVVLTFDDGPHGQYTDRLLDGLKERDVKATFFVTSIGRNNSDWESDKRILTRMVNEGHEIGNHTQHHKTLTKMTDKEIKEEISIISDRVKEMTGYEIKLFRPPSGAFSKKVVDAANLAMVHWTLDTNDWRYLNENTLKKYAEENSLTPEEAKEQRVKYLLDVLVGRLPNNDVYTGALKHGSIILFHDLYEGTVELALSLIDELKKDGYVFLNLTEAVETVGTAPAAGEAYKSIWEGYKINIR